jgi:hypothetical protein
VKWAGPQHNQTTYSMLVSHQIVMVTCFVRIVTENM